VSAARAGRHTERVRRDRWAEWILNRRFGGDEAAAAAMLRNLGPVRDRVLDRAGIRPGEAVLDVGCGDGLLAFGALERVGQHGRVIFSDVSQDLLDVAGGLAAGDPRCEFVVAAAEDLSPIPDESVDVVTTRSVIIYVAEKERAFAEFFRVLRPGGRVSMFEPINRFASPEPAGSLFGVAMDEVWPLALRVRERYDAMTSGEQTMVDFDERDLLELAVAAGFATAELELEASIARGRLWGREPQPLDDLLDTAPNPNAPTLREVLEAELTEAERERLLGHLRPRFDAGEMTGRHAVAYLVARKTSATPSFW
jgi:ubiquinone/menaquinone biosynthesis C-methylase UbiE